MKPETLKLQNQIEPGCGIAVEPRIYPIAVVSSTGRFKWLVLSECKEISINEWKTDIASGLQHLSDGTGTEIPAADLIAELKAIISELEGNNQKEKSEPMENGIHDWRAINRSAPVKEGVIVWTKIDDEKGERNVQRLKKQGNLWFHADGSTYVYYTPTHYSLT